MINLILRLDNVRHLIKTFHYDEYSGDISVHYFNLKSHEDLKSLKDILAENNTFSTFDIEEINSTGDLRLVYEDIESNDIISLDYADEYEPYYSFLGLLRYLISLDCKVLVTNNGKEYVLNLNSINISSSSFGIYMRYLVEDEENKRSWRTYNLFYNDIDGNWVGYKDIKFLIPQSSLLGYEPYVVRNGKYIYKNFDQYKEYDIIQVNPDISFFDEKPISFTSEECLGAFQFLCDVYELVSPIIAEYIFEKDTNVVYNKSYIPSEKISHDGYIKIRGNKKIDNALRTKYEREIISISEYGIEKSMLAKYDNMFNSYRKLFQAFASQKDNALTFYNSLQNTKSLMALTILEAKISLFYYDKPFLYLLSRFEDFYTNITGYTITVRVGGVKWRPIDYCS